MSNPYRDKLLSISVSGAATPSRNRTLASNMVWHAQNERDVPAYRRLRADGVQPQTVHGAAALEAKAETVEDIEGPKPEVVDAGQ